MDQSSLTADANSRPMIVDIMVRSSWRYHSLPSRLISQVSNKTATNIETHPEAFSVSKRLTSGADQIVVSGKMIEHILSLNFEFNE